MVIHDPIYGAHTITSPVIIDLIHTPAFQRLKGVSQFGLPSKYYHLDGFSRYEHSIGVYILLHRLGASEKEQVAGLLHDISHTAFSHIVDWVVGNELTEDFQDKRHLSVLHQEDLAKILTANNFTIDDIADYEAYALLEKPAPDICADRVDYLFRESGPSITNQCLPKLVVYKNEIVFLDVHHALVFAKKFLECQEVHWAGYEAVTRYRLFARLLKQAINEGVIVFEDLLQTDNWVIDKLCASNKQQYQEILRLLENKHLDFLPKSFERIPKKFRYVDPKVLVDASVVRLTDMSTDFKQLLQEAKQQNTKGCYYGIFNKSS